MNAWVWGLWLLFVVVSFAFIERYAFDHPNRQWTLSRTVSTIGSKWPLSLVLWGMFVGGLSVHFFWAYANPMLGGGVCG